MRSFSYLLVCRFELEANKGTDSTDKSFKSSNSVHKVDPSELCKTPKGLVPIGPSSRVIAVLSYGMVYTDKSNSGISLTDRSS